MNIYCNTFSIKKLVELFKSNEKIKNIKNIEIANEFFKRQLIENDNLSKPTELFPFTSDLITFTKTLSKEYESYKKSI